MQFGPKAARPLATEKILLLITNLVIIIVGLFFIFEASSLESVRALQKEQQRQLRLIEQQQELQQTAVIGGEEVIEEEVQLVQPHVWLLIRKQLTGFGIGLIVMIVAMFIPKNWWPKLAPFLYIAAIILLLMCLIPPFSNPFQGAKRWIKIFGQSFQPIELVKLAMVIFFAWMLSRKRDLVNLLIYLAVPGILILLQPDFASFVLIMGTVTIMYFLAGAKWRDLGILAAVGAVAMIILTLVAPYRMDRVRTFFNQSKQTQETVLTIDEREKQWHSQQLKYAFGRGGLFGVGVGNSIQKYGYLPETSSDSIFAIVGEEIGWIGTLGVLLLYAFYFYLAWRLISRAENKVSLKLLGYGLIIMLALQTIIHLFAITGITPLTGITLPFFSYGSSSLVASMFMTGMIIGLAQNSTPDKIKTEDLPVTPKRRARK